MEERWAEEVNGRSDGIDRSESGCLNGLVLEGLLVRTLANQTAGRWLSAGWPLEREDDGSRPHVETSTEAPSLALTLFRRLRKDGLARTTATRSPVILMNQVWVPVLTIPTVRQPSVRPE